MNSILKGCKQLQPVSHCNSPAIGNGQPQRFFLAFSLFSPFPLPIISQTREEKNLWDERTRVGYEDPFSLYKFRLQTPRPANRRSTENTRRKRKETRERKREIERWKRVKRELETKAGMKVETVMVVRWTKGGLDVETRKHGAARAAWKIRN